MAKILVVDDDELNSDMLSRRLERSGFEVIVAVDGQDAVDKARDERPDLILMDLSMPVMDGFEATRILKSRDETRATPVIGLSALAMAGDREKALAAGCDDYESKPVEMPRLLKLISTRLRTDAP